MGLLANLFSGGVIGGLLRLAPEIIHLFTAKAEAQRHRDDLSHELNMFQAQASHELAMAEKNITAQKIDQDTSWIKAVAEANRPTGIKWVDALNATVRPVVTYWFFGIFALIRTVDLIKTAVMGTYGEMQALWTTDDQQLLGTILGYWFIDRTIGKLRGK